MSRLKLLLVTLSLTAIVLAANALPPMSAAAAAGSVTVALNAPATVTPGSDFTASVDISQVTSLDATDYLITFDPAVVSFSSVSDGLIGSDIFPVDQVNSTNVSAVIVVQNVKGTAGVSGSGSLAKLRFHAVGAPGQSSSISFVRDTMNNVRYGVLSDSAAREIPSVWNGTTVTLVESSPIPTPIAGPSGGAGGGGGGFAPMKTGGLNGTAPAVNGSGYNMVGATLTSDDQQATLSIPQGTVMFDASGRPLGSITCSKPASLPTPPTGGVVVGGYDFGPDGANFNPPITITLKFTQADLLAAGTDAANLQIGFWNGTSWQILVTSQVNLQTNEISAAVTHFTNYAVIGSPAVQPTPPTNPVTVSTGTPTAPPNKPATPAKFSVTNLKIAPAQVNVNAPIEIQTTVSNTGGSQGLYDVILNINGTEVARQQVNLNAGGSKTVAFKIEEDSPEKYFVEVNGNTGEFTVLATQLSVPLSANGQGPGEWRWPWLIIGGATVGLALLMGLSIISTRHKKE